MKRGGGRVCFAIGFALEHLLRLAAREAGRQRLLASVGLAGGRPGLARGLPGLAVTDLEHLPARVCSIAVPVLA